jgi:hypothetical protein
MRWFGCWAQAIRESAALDDPRTSASSELVGSVAEAPVRPLLLPHRRPVPQHLGEPQPLRLSPVEDHFHNVRRQAGEGATGKRRCP